jgi:UDP-N-acetyl-D-mannosaminuronic acid dehydrogenase
LILCTPHRPYKHADFKGKPVVDVWGHLENVNGVG